jgi:8-oxo-dGTP pyrophosphatase MutT (NUDIX family)
VVRRDGRGLRILLVTSRRSPGEWVLPKGHIEKGETPVETAVREVLEESGVTAVAGAALGDLEFSPARGFVRARFFLMTFRSEAEPGESRERAWLRPEEATKRLHWDDARELVQRAVDRTSRSASKRSAQ